MTIRKVIKIWNVHCVLIMNGQIVGNVVCLWLKRRSCGLEFVLSLHFFRLDFINQGVCQINAETTVSGFRGIGLWYLVYIGRTGKVWSVICGGENERKFSFEFEGWAV